MSFFTSFQELLDYDHSTNLNGFHFSNSLFGFDSNSIPPLDNLPPPAAVDPPINAALATRASLTTPSPILEPPPLLETPKLHHQTVQQPQPQQLQQNQNHHPQTSPIPIVSKFQLKVTPNNEIYISNESGTFYELAGSFVPSAMPHQRCEVPQAPPLPMAPPVAEPIQLIAPEPIEPSVPPPLEMIHPTAPSPEPPKTLYCIERGIKRPLSPSDARYCNSGIFRSQQANASPLKKKSTSTSNGNSVSGTLEDTSAAKLVVSNVINNGLIVNKKHLSTNGEEESERPSASTPERRIMRPKKRKRKAAPKVTLEAKVEPTNGRIVSRVTPDLIKPLATLATVRKLASEPIVTKRVLNHHDKQPRPTALKSAAPGVGASTGELNTLNFSGIKERAAQEAIFVERVGKQSSPKNLQPPPPPAPPQQIHQEMQPIVQTKSELRHSGGVSVQELRVPVAVATMAPPVPVAPTPTEVVLAQDESSPASVELKVVADLVMDKNVFGHISLLNNSHDRGKAVIYQNPVTSTNVIYSILNPKALNLSLGGANRGTTATLTLQPHRGGRKPKKRGRKKKVPLENGTVDEAALVATAEPKPHDPDVPVMVTRSGRLSKPPRYANNFFQNIKQKTDLLPPLPPPPPPPPVTRLDLPAPDPETAEKLPNFSAALSSTVSPVNTMLEPEPKRKITVPLQYRCATCNKIYLGKRMQRHLEKYPHHNSERDCVDAERTKKTNQEEKSTYLYKHLFDLLQKFTEKDKGRIMLKEISNFVDFVRALIPRLITNDEHNSTVEYIDHNVADVLRLNHGKYRLKLSSLAEEYEKLNLTVNLVHSNTNGTTANNNNNNNNPPPPPVTSTPNGIVERQTFSFNADDLLNQSSSFPSLTTLMHEHNILMQPNGNNNNNIISNNNNVNINHHQYSNNHHLPHQHHNNHQHHHPHLHHHLPLIGTSCHDDAMNSLSGLCKSPVQHSTSGMMALNLY